MARMTGLAAMAIGLLALAACGEEPGAGGVTAEEARQLNEAAEMLDTSPDSLTASDDAALGNGEVVEVEEEPAANEAVNGAE